MIETNNLNDLVRADDYGANDTQIGSVRQVYVDTDPQIPFCFTTKTGQLGTPANYAAMNDASFDGDIVRVRDDEAFVQSALCVADDGALSEAEKHTLSRYYAKAAWTTETRANEEDTERASADGNTEINSPTEGFELSGPTPDEARTHSEERLVATKETGLIERVALGPETVVEQKEVNAKIAHEEIELVHAEPTSTIKSRP